MKKRRVLANCKRCAFGYYKDGELKCLFNRRIGDKYCRDFVPIS